MMKFQAHLLATQLMKEHGLVGWRFKIDTKTSRRRGCCKYATKTISVSEWYLGSDESMVRDTILHEIAHALLPPGNGHNHVWRDMARRIGAIPVACKGEEYGADLAVKVGKYVADCECGTPHYFHREVKRTYICRKTRKPLKFRPTTPQERSQQCHRPDVRRPAPPSTE